MVTRPMNAADLTPGAPKATGHDTLHEGHYGDHGGRQTPYYTDVGSRWNAPYFQPLIDHSAAAAPHWH